MFDETTQLSLENLKEVKILPYKEVITNNNSCLYDYSNDGIVFFWDYSQIKASYIKLVEEMFEYKIQEDLDSNFKFMFELEEINPKNYDHLLYLDFLNQFLLYNFLRCAYGTAVKEK